MPQKFDRVILDLGKIPEGECKYLPVNCHWTTPSTDASLTVITTCLKWTFNYDFCVRLIAHSQGAQNVSKQKDLDDHQTLRSSLTDALTLYKVFPEPLLNI